MFRATLLLCAGGLILADGIAVGRWTDRWGANRELSAAAQRLQQVPMTMGDWNGTALDLEPRVVALAGFQGYVVRRYENQRSGAVLSLLVACGRPGPLCVHTPEVCYGGAGFKMAGATDRYVPGTWDGAPVPEFWQATFTPANAANPGKLRVYWSWYYKDAWNAADNPRWKFASAPVLYKMYVSQEYVEGTDEAAREDCIAFIHTLVPELEKAFSSDR